MLILHIIVFLWSDVTIAFLTCTYTVSLKSRTCYKVVHFMFSLNASTVLLWWFMAWHRHVKSPLCRYGLIKMSPCSSNWNNKLQLRREKSLSYIHHIPIAIFIVFVPFILTLQTSQCGMFWGKSTANFSPPYCSVVQFVTIKARAL